MNLRESTCLVVCFRSQEFLKYIIFQRTKTRQGKGLICLKFSQKEKNAINQNVTKVWVAHKCIDLTESLVWWRKINTRGGLELWIVSSQQDAQLYQNTLQPRGHKKVKTNLKSKDKKERDGVQVLPAHIYKYQLKPFIPPSGKDVWKKAVCGIQQDMWISVSVLFFLHLLILKKDTSCFPNYVRDTPIIF